MPRLDLSPEQIAENRFAASPNSVPVLVPVEQRNEAKVGEAQ